MQDNGREIRRMDRESMCSQTILVIKEDSKTINLNHMENTHLETISQARSIHIQGSGKKVN
jgi:hypothetical protein